MFSKGNQRFKGKLKHKQRRERYLFGGNFCINMLDFDRILFTLIFFYWPCFDM